MKRGLAYATIALIPGAKPPVLGINLRWLDGGVELLVYYDTSFWNLLDKLRVYVDAQTVTLAPTP